MKSTNIEIYEIFVREHEAMLHAYVCGLVSDPVLADEICQESFVWG